MSFQTNHTKISENLCKGCSACIKICPSSSISLINNKAVITKQECLYCGHCEAICSSSAIKVKGPNYNKLNFNMLTSDTSYTKPGEFNTSQLINLIASRRSCRSYKPTSINQEVIEELIQVGTLAPSGTNCQPWSFITITDRSKIEELGDITEQFFLKLNKLAKNIFLRNILKFFGINKLSNYYKNHLQSVEDAIKLKHSTGKDMLFHGAPALIIVAADSRASCPREDALLATQNILLTAHAEGLGTCLIGFLVEAIKQDKTLNKFLKLNKHTVVYSVIAIGLPAITFTSTTGRFPAKITEIN